MSIESLPEDELSKSRKKVVFYGPRGVDKDFRGAFEGGPSLLSIEANRKIMKDPVGIKTRLLEILSKRIKGARKKSVDVPAE
ncbi:MAG: hypothetical protein PHU71_02980 [Candidatus Gracilibacteria bacterium]|nr:hypothetical protein [Candidatus Gracilibacteria bacterium]